jgi:hypothetical protein
VLSLHVQVIDAIVEIGRSGGGSRARYSSSSTSVGNAGEHPWRETTSAPQALPSSPQRCHEAPARNPHSSSGEKRIARTQCIEHFDRKPGHLERGSAGPGTNRRLARVRAPA